MQRFSLIFLLSHSRWVLYIDRRVPMWDRHRVWQWCSSSVKLFCEVLRFQKCDYLHFCFQSWWKKFWRAVSSLVSCGGKTNSSLRLWKLSEHSDCIPEPICQQGCTRPYHNKVRIYHWATLRVLVTYIEQ